MCDDSSLLSLRVFKGDTDLMYMALRKGAEKWINALTSQPDDTSMSDNVVGVDSLHSVALEYFSTLAKTTSLQLFEIYKMDFDLFGYDPSPFLEKGR